jgi:hypothetical protein
MRLHILLSLLVAAGAGCRRTATVQQHDQRGTDTVLVSYPGASVTDVLHAIKVAGADSARRRYFGAAPVETYCGEAITDSISRGDSLWLVAADQLSQGADACVASGLTYAIRVALASAPAQVLRIWGTRWGVDWLCQIPHGDGIEDRVIHAYYRRVTAALDALSDPAVSVSRDHCLAAMRRSYEQVYPPAG